MKLDYRFGIIYKVTNKFNNKVYIGQTVQSIKNRWRGHCCKKGCTSLHNAIIKYGKDNFNIEPIESEVPVALLDERETYWIKFYKSYKKEFGYNILLEGGHGRRGLSKCSEEEIKEIINLYYNKVSYTEIGKKYNMNRRSIKALIQRNLENPIEVRAARLKDKVNLKELENYLKLYNPQAKDIVEALKISPATLFKFTKKINYKFIPYKKRNLEYNSSKSVQHPKLPWMKMYSELTK